MKEETQTPKKPRGRPKSAKPMVIRGLILSQDMYDEAGARVAELGLESVSAYLRGLIRQELVLRDYYTRMQHVTA